MIDGQKMKKLRISAGISAEQLGVAAGVTGRHIRRIEAEESEPTLGVAVMVARALGVPVSSLVHTNEPVTASSPETKNGARAA